MGTAALSPLTQQIGPQLAFNRRKNLFCLPEASTFGFAPGTVDLLRTKALQAVDAAAEAKLLERLVPQVLTSLYQVNQFYHFSPSDIAVLKAIYKTLFHELKTTAPDQRSLDQLAKKHYVRLQTWLTQTNPFAREIYPSHQPQITQEVVCAEYSAELQLRLLNINQEQLLEPIVDVGCGQQAHLVTYLRAQGLKAYGIDRSCQTNAYLTQTDWFNFDWQPNFWGTLISNVGFSNHFAHHHLRRDGDFVAYAQTYMRILHSLKTGGSFFYAPDLPFMEELLPREQYRITKSAIVGTGYAATRVEKL
ncbi:MAG: hypothetical protein ACO1OQ_04040 [Rufibacter sp.]